MNSREFLRTALTFLLLPLGLALASFALRGFYGTAVALYLFAVALHLFTEALKTPWKPDASTFAALCVCRRLYFLMVLGTLQALGSCPVWFVGLVLAATLMQWSGFVLLRSRLSPPILPELATWSLVARAVLPGVYLCDFLLIELFPNNFRFSPAFHLTGYCLLASLFLLQLAHDFYRVRRPLLFWMRLLAFQPH